LTSEKSLEDIPPPRTEERTESGYLSSEPRGTVRTPSAKCACSVFLFLTETAGFFWFSFIAKAFSGLNFFILEKYFSTSSTDWPSLTPPAKTTVIFEGLYKDSKYFVKSSLFILLIMSKQALISTQTRVHS
ncbi:MAG: hypothetical protein US51_C0025G0001, partial [Microgenomates group bacterium GW2011_GWA2_37_6]